MQRAIGNLLGIILLLVSCQALGLSCRRVPADEIVESYDNLYVIHFFGTKLVSPELERVKGEYKIVNVLRSKGISRLPTVEYALRDKNSWLSDIPVGEDYFLFWNENQNVVEWQWCSEMNRYESCREYELIDAIGSAQRMNLICEARMKFLYSIRLYHELKALYRRVFPIEALPQEVISAGA